MASDQQLWPPMCYRQPINNNIGSCGLW